jgi:AcrR family transcriptional regulator
MESVLSEIMAKHASQETRRAQILAAATTCLADKGYHRTSIDDIAALTGLSKGAIYHHFGSKREILLALFEEWSADLLTRWRSIGEQSDPLEALSRDAQEALTLVEDIVPLSRAGLEFCSHAVRDDDLRQRIAAVYADARRHLTGLIEEARQLGLLGDVKAQPMAIAFLAFFEGLFLMKAIDPEAVDVEAAWREGTSALLRGLTSPATAEVARS